MLQSIGIGSILPTLIEYYHTVPPSKATQLGTYPTVFAGIGALIAIIVSRGIGTRPVLIFSSALAVASIIWAAVSHGKDRGIDSHIAARCFIFLGIGGAETMVAQVIQDIHYIHLRNTKISTVWAFSGVVAATGGILSTYIVSALSWRAMYHIFNIIPIIALILIVAFVPETSWLRTKKDLSKPEPRRFDVVMNCKH